MPSSYPPRPPVCSSSVPPTNRPYPYTAAPSTSANRAKPSPSPTAAATKTASCRHCGSRSGRAHSSMLAALRARCSAVAMPTSVPPFSKLKMFNAPVLRSRLPWSRSDSTRRTSSASTMPGRSFAASSSPNMLHPTFEWSCRRHTFSPAPNLEVCSLSLSTSDVGVGLWGRTFVRVRGQSTRQRLIGLHSCASLCRTQSSAAPGTEVAL